MFELSDFDVFGEQTLAGRMQAIKTQLDPKFEVAAAELLPVFSSVQVPQYAHIAKHLRRHKNPPPDTWVAFSIQPRGYKMVPHIELGLWDDRLFLWLAALVESKPQPDLFSGLPHLVADLPGEWDISRDHTKKSTVQLSATTLEIAATKFKKINSSEFLIGKMYLRTDPLFHDPSQLWADIRQRAEALTPLYVQLLTNTAKTS